jgi:hypothetical protein
MKPDTPMRAYKRRAWHKRDKIKRAQSRKEYAVRVRKATLEKLGNKCNWPGCTWADPRALQIDHIYGGGNLESRKIGVISICLKILKMDNPGVKYQLLCANHNWVKRVENKEHL